MDYYHLIGVQLRLRSVDSVLLEHDRCSHDETNWEVGWAHISLPNFSTHAKMSTFGNMFLLTSFQHIQSSSKILRKVGKNVWAQSITKKVLKQLWNIKTTNFLWKPSLLPVPDSPPSLLPPHARTNTHGRFTYIDDLKSPFQHHRQSAVQVMQLLQPLSYR